MRYLGARLMTSACDGASALPGVLKELAVSLPVYNLVRLAMLRQAHACVVSAARISFRGCVALGLLPGCWGWAAS